ncbi:MAG: NADH-quinone oxidoreductase subunit N [Proteobacteria bacterium]|nr:NADH-quinone oxidoreductase subunit N [Pseudomonadota bacterium]
MTSTFNAFDLMYIIPLLVLAVTGLLLVLAESFFKGRQRNHLMGLAVAGAIAAAVTAMILFRYTPDDEQGRLVLGMLKADRFAYFFTVLISFATAVTALVGASYQDEHNWQSGEFYGILLLVATGMTVMAMAADLVSAFIGIETMSLGIYVLVTSRRQSLRGTEAAMKYFVMGAVASAFMLYGIALVYGATGTTNLDSIEKVLANVQDLQLGLLVAGVFLLVIALAFKVAAIPFHMWAPDAYEGAPTPVTGFMATAVKASAFAVFIRIFVNTFEAESTAFGHMGWTSPLIVLAALTMTIANVAALRQENIKRMLAYSSISHAGVALVGVIAAGLGNREAATTAVMYYLAAYTVTTLGAFTVVAWLGSRDRERVLVDDFSGLASRHPGAALAMTVFMLSLGGIPPTAGFFGKFYVFKSAMEASDQALLWLVILGVINSAVSIYYYLRVVMTMYFRDPVEEFKPLRAGAITVVLVICALAILEMGILPGFWLGLAGG